MATGCSGTHTRGAERDSSPSQPRPSSSSSQSPSSVDAAARQRSTLGSSVGASTGSAAEASGDSVSRQRCQASRVSGSGLSTPSQPRSSSQPSSSEALGAEPFDGVQVDTAAGAGAAAAATAARRRAAFTDGMDRRTRGLRLRLQAWHHEQRDADDGYD